MENNGLKELNRIQTILFMIGGLMMVVGVGCFVLMFHHTIASVVFLCGATIFAVIQCMQVYQGRDLTLRRLKSIMNLADLFFVLAGVLMIDTATSFMRPMFTNLETYLEIVYNKWVILLLIAVVLELYTTHRISHELAKQSRSEQE